MSDWIKFLRKYGPIPQNDNMYDEAINRASKRTKFNPITFESPFHRGLNENFGSEDPSSIILTGTAGDGKTYLCRMVWEDLGGDADEWNSEKKIRKIFLSNGKELVVIKDLSELRDEEKQILKDLAISLHDASSDTIFLIAANDGQLVEAWEKIRDSSEVEEVRRSIEDALVTGAKKCGRFPLLLLNLSQYRSEKLLQRVLDAVFEHPGWEGCENCHYASNDVSSRCPIWENLQRLKNPLFRNRLSALITLCDYNGLHIPIRQLLLLVTNALLGHQEVRDQLMRCTDVPKLIQEGKAWYGNIYTNVFGTNLRRRRLPEIFEVLRGFGIGDETSNRIDNLLIFGIDDPDEKQRLYFECLVGDDEYYGANKHYRMLQSAYIEGEDQNAAEEFFGALAKQRQRLFFTIPDNDAEDLRLWELGVFHYAGEYLYDVIGALDRGNRVPSRIINRLVRGLNRIFTGMLTSSDQFLWLATSGSYSQARISIMVDGRVSVMPDRSEYVAIEKDENGLLALVVNLDRETSVSLPLHLTRYEFLSRVAEGALPSSFSRECYEDILSFKSQVLSRYRDVQAKHDTTPTAGDEMLLRLLDLDIRSQLNDRRVIVRLDGHS